MSCATRKRTANFLPCAAHSKNLTATLGTTKELFAVSSLSRTWKNSSSYAKVDTYQTFLKRIKKVSSHEAPSPRCYYHHRHRYPTTTALPLHIFRDAGGRSTNHHHHHHACYHCRAHHHHATVGDGGAAPPSLSPP
jgi:hypothetical protein